MFAHAVMASVSDSGRVDLGGIWACFGCLWRWIALSWFGDVLDRDKLGACPGIGQISQFCVATLLRKLVRILTFRYTYSIVYIVHIVCDAARGLVLLAMAGFVRCCCCCLVFRYIRTRVTLDFSGS